jgi:hypothetical protein
MQPTQRRVISVVNPLTIRHDTKMPSNHCFRQCVWGGTDLRNWEICGENPERRVTLRGEPTGRRRAAVGVLFSDNQRPADSLLLCPPYGSAEFRVRR